MDAPWRETMIESSARRPRAHINGRDGRSSAITCSPFLRWAGGKRLLLPKLLRFVPRNLRGTYFEPFLGGGSVFFALKPARAVLADANLHLIHCYSAVRGNPSGVAAALRRLARRANKRQYYKVRREYNDCTRPSMSQAARFIYLNKACFNGVFRVNRAGRFNVPYGYRKNPAYPSTSALARASELLSNATLRGCDYARALREAKRGDFIYLDPPYPPLSDTAFFAHYTADRFGVEEQRRLASVFLELHSRGCRVLLSNADTPAIRRAYAKFLQIGLEAIRFITCKAKKHVVGELLIMNYEDAL